MINWILFGLITGLILHTIYPYRAKGGLLVAAVLGIFGAVLGGFLGS